MRGTMIEIRRNGAWHVATPPVAVPPLDWPADLFSGNEATVIGSGITERSLPSRSMIYSLLTMND
jgi:hypothetical protein